MNQFPGEKLLAPGPLRQPGTNLSSPQELGSIPSRRSTSTPKTSTDTMILEMLRDLAFVIVSLFPQTLTYIDSASAFCAPMIGRQK